VMAKGKGKGYEGGEGSEAESESKEDQDSYLVKWAIQCRETEKQIKAEREQQNKQNYDVFHLRHDFSHKIPGQSREVLSRQSMAVEQTASFFQQALIDEGDWWDAEARDAKSETKIKVRPDVIEDLTNFQLEQAKMIRHVGRGVKSGILGALIVTKVGGAMKPLPAYVANRSKDGKKATLKKLNKEGWRLDLRIVNQKNFYPDSTGAGLYNIEDIYCDYHELCKLDPADGWDLELIEGIEPQAFGDDDAEEQLDARTRSNQGQANRSYRHRVKVTEYWGTVLGEDGDILHENVVFNVANDKYLIRPPTENPFWHQEDPYVTSPVLDITEDSAVWPRALADAGTKHNIALNELYNLMVDGGMRAANGVGMLRTDWLEDPSELEDGIKPGTYLKVNSQCPPGAKALEMVQSGTVPPDAQNTFNIMSQEFNASMLTSDIRAGIQPRRDVPATQIVETSQTITSVFKGITEQIEQNWIKKILWKSAMLTCQYSDDIDEQEIRDCLGDRADSFLQLTPEERFAETVQGMKFSVSGITQHLAKSQDFQKIATLMQTIGASPVLMESYAKRFSVDELLYEAMRALGINTRRLELPQAEQEMMKGGGGQPQQPQPEPNQMSQVTSPNTGSLEDQLGSAAGPQVPQADFPRSRATPAGGQG
jgi:hypothetical protein